jgi:hypothetical protein
LRRGIFYRECFMMLVVYYLGPVRNSGIYCTVCSVIGIKGYRVHFCWLCHQGRVIS